MRNLALALGLVFASASAHAATANDKAPQGNGNFRRADAIKAAGFSKDRNVTVRGGTNAAGFDQSAKLPKTERVLFVARTTKNNTQVRLVKAPLDLNQSVKRLSADQTHRFGLITPTDAKKLASRNTGMLAGNGKDKVRLTGMSERGSYQFKQTSPSTITTKGQYAARLSDITRTVTVTGTGESARAYGYKSLAKN